jgi:hypothetical protein
MATQTAFLQPRQLPDGYRRFGEVRGTGAGEFPGSDTQIAVRYRRSGSQWGLGGEITVAWDSDGGSEFTGSSTERSVPVRIGRHVGQYHAGYWLPGPGSDQVALPGGGMAHWDTGFVHSLTVRTDGGVVALRCPYEHVPDLPAMLKIAASLPALST